MEFFWVYMVLCTDASYYVGITNDLGRRLWEHNEGLDRHCYTFMRRPVKLVYCEQYNDASAAIRREKQIKGWNRKKKVALIASDFNEIRRLSRE